MSQTPAAPDSGQNDPVDPVQEGAAATGPASPTPPTPPVDSSVEDDAAETEDELEDEQSKQSFPTSDPPSTWAGDDSAG